MNVRTDQKGSDIDYKCSKSHSRHHIEDLGLVGSVGRQWILSANELGEVLATQKQANKNTHKNYLYFHFNIWKITDSEQD